MGRWIDVSAATKQITMSLASKPGTRDWGEKRSDPGGGGLARFAQIWREQV